MPAAGASIAGLALTERQPTSAEPPPACTLRLSFAGSCAFGPALSATMEAIPASTDGSSPALACRGMGTLRTAVVISGPRGVMQIHAHGGRQSDTQRMRLQFIGIQENAHSEHAARS